MASAPVGTRPVLLADGAPLARYGHLGLLADLADITTEKTQAVWLIVPTNSRVGATLDRTPIPLT